MAVGDQQYHQQIKQSIEEAKDSEEVDVRISVPKVLRGNNKHVNAALYLKRVCVQPDQCSNSHPSQQEDQFRKNQTRCELFTSLEKNITARRPSQDIKDNFQVTTLDDLHNELIRDSEKLLRKVDDLRRVNS